MRIIFTFTLLLLIAACQPIINGEPASTPIPSPDLVQLETPSQPYVYLTPTPGYPGEGFGPDDFPVDINPLTGLSTDPVLLDRRPIIVKVSNLPRIVRPQYGLSRADIVYEYYTEQGTTRFAAIYYSQEAEKVGSIRSARFFDEHLIDMYGGIFVFGSADERTRKRLFESNFSKRLIVEWEAGCPALCRPDPVTNFLIGNTIAIREYVENEGISDDPQDMEGMRFQLQVPDGGQPVERVYAWYSGVIYNRWDYDPPSGRYYRYVDVENALNGQPEVYKPLRDALGDIPVAADNVVILFMPHEFFSVSPEVVEMRFSESGPAVAFRDGQAYELNWVRPSRKFVVYLATEGGEIYPFKPGTTWFEVMGLSTRIIKNEKDWRYEMRFP